MDVFTETLRSWQNFYFMIGGAAAALLGLMFVALSLGRHLVNEKTLEDMKLFVNPSVVYFVSVLLVPCLMLVPAFEPLPLAALLFLGGALGLARSIGTAKRLIGVARQYQDFERADWLAQVIGPVAGYGLLVATAMCFVVNQWALGFAAVWLATIVLLVCAIVNTWALVIWIIEQRHDDD